MGSKWTLWDGIASLPYMPQAPVAAAGSRLEVAAGGCSPTKAAEVYS